MSRLSSLVGVAVLIAALSSPQANACSKDNDCKGDRICQSGKCTGAPRAAACKADNECPGELLCVENKCSQSSPPLVAASETPDLGSSALASTAQPASARKNLEQPVPSANLAPGPARPGPLAQPSSAIGYRAWGTAGFANVSVSGPGGSSSSSGLALIAGAALGYRLNEDFELVALANLTYTSLSPTGSLIPLTFGAGVATDRLAGIKLLAGVGFTDALITGIDNAPGETGLGILASASYPLSNHLGLDAMFAFHSLSNSVTVWSLSGGLACSF